MAAAGCTERGATPNPTVPSESPVTSAESTAVPVTSMEVAIQTATARPSATPVPPTPTPTYGELTVSRLGWYSDEETDQESKAYLITLLLEISQQYPLLFEALLQRTWINPTETPDDFRQVNETVNLIQHIADIADDETAGIKLLRMPFLDSIDSDKSDKYRAFQKIVSTSAESLTAFLDHATANGGLTDNDREVDVFHLYMEAQDPVGLERIYRGRLPEEWDAYMLGRMIDLYSTYPAVYQAASESFVVASENLNFVLNVSKLAAIDDQLARRLAEMPFNTIRGGLDHTAWYFVTQAAEADNPATVSLFDQYELQGGADHSTLALFVMDTASIFAPDVVETVRTFDWVRDGVDRPEMRKEDWGTRAVFSREERTLVAILGATARNEDWVNKLVLKAWIRNDLTSEEVITVDRILQLGDSVADLLLDMQFLDEVDREDSVLLVPIANFVRAADDSIEFPLSEVLNDERLNGEITDANRHLVESVLDDYSESN